MTKPEILKNIQSMIDRTLSEKGLPTHPVSQDTALLGSSLGIDSLDLAAIVVELSETTGQDPFQSGFVEFRTAGELADLYCAHTPGSPE